MTRVVWLGFAILTATAATACISAPTSVLLHIRAEQDVPTPELLLINLYDDSGRVVKERRVPASGAPALPGDLVLYPPGGSAGVIRVLVQATSGGGVVGEGAGQIRLEPGGQVELTVVLKAGHLPDQDKDGVPDTIDNCKTIPNPDQHPCGGPDGGTDGDGPKPDAATDGPGDGPDRDALMPDAPTPDLGPPPAKVVSSAGWGLRSPLTIPRDLIGVYGTAQDNVWVVGAQGTVLQFNGHVWISHDPGVTALLNAVWTTSAKQVWVVGAGGTILHYDGVTWTQQTSGTTKGLRDIWGSGPKDIWAVGDKVVLRYDGAAWTAAAPSTDYNVYEVMGASASEVWFATQRSTCDGVVNYNGALFTAPAIPANTNDMYGLWSNKSNDVWLCGENGKLLHFDGKAWAVETSTTGDNLTAVWGSSGGKVWAVGESGAIVQRQSNGSWQTVTSGTSNTLRRIWGSDPKDIWAVGHSGTLLHYDGAGWTGLSGAVTTEGLNDVWVDAAGKVWFVGAKGTIIRLDKTTYTAFSSGTTADLHGVWGCGPADIWAVGSGGAALHYTGGTTWTKVDPKTGKTLYALWGTGASDVWAVGGWSEPCGTAICSYGRVAHFDGVSWSSQTLGSSVLRGVWSSGPADVWAVGHGGAVQHYTGSGWKKISIGTGKRLEDVWGSGPSDVWIAGDDGTIRRYDGLAWSGSTTGTGVDLDGIWGAGPSGPIWAVGRHGTLLRHTSGAWSKVYSGVPWADLHQDQRRQPREHLGRGRRRDDLALRRHLALIDQDR